MSGNGWNCTLNTLSCVRNDVLASDKAYPPITLTVNVGNNAPTSVTNVVTVSGGGDQNPKNNSFHDVTTINPSPDLTIALSHSPDPFTVAKSGTYTITVTNVGNAPTSGTVTVNDSLPSGMSVTTFDDPGWSCFGGTPFSCSRSDTLGIGSSYPPIVLNLNVSGGGSAVTNTVSVTGGGEFDTANDTASDRATILPVAMTPDSSTNMTITAGNTASFSFGVNLSSGQAVGTITFVASGLPPHSKATFSPASLTQTGEMQMSVSTSGNGFTAALLPHNIGSLPLYSFAFLLLLKLRSLVIARRRRSLFLTGLSIAALGSALLLTGCNALSGGPPVTPSGTFTITVTATSSNSAVAPVNTNVTLTVQ
jgi:uncharacterized repeat protein (TIGR01451 family)